LLLSLGSVLGLVSAAFALVLAAEHGPVPPPARAARQPARAERPQLPLLLAGSGSNLPLTERLVTGLALERPQLRVELSPSIGSGGGLRALRDGVIDVALVSRPVAREEAVGLRVEPYARTAVVVAAHPSVADDAIGLEQLRASLQGGGHRFAGGVAAVPVLREPGDSSAEVVMDAHPELREPYRQAWAGGELPVRLTDQAMEQALLTIPGAIGFFDLGIIEARRLPLRVLSLEGERPTREAIAAGRHPMLKELAFAVPAAPSAPTAALLEFVFGPRGRAIIEAHGYVPVPRSTP
jgi:phosphate transport system substrate-binding protein